MEKIIKYLWEYKIPVIVAVALGKLYIIGVKVV